MKSKAPLVHHPTHDRRLVRSLYACLLLLAAHAAPVCGQPADSVTARQDSETVFGAAADTTAAFSPGQIPIRTPFLAPTEHLQRTPNSFAYDLGERGWAHGWSRFALAPRHAQLNLNNLPFTSPITGAPLYQLLPFDLLRPIRTGGVSYGQPHSIQTAVRSFAAPRPLTELRFHSGSSTLQSISAAHAQQWSMGGTARPDSLRILFGYTGQSTNGIYPRSQMRLRRVLGRLTYWQPTWSARLQYMYNEHGQDIHAGVLPRGSLTRLFQPVGAQVAPNDARREIARHDLFGRFKLRWHDSVDPLTVRGFWSSHRLTYEEFGETWEAPTTRIGGQIRQSVGLGRHRLGTQAEFWTTRITAGNGLGSGEELLESEYHITIVDSVRWPGGSVYGRAGWHGEGDISYGSGVLGISRRIGFLRAGVEASTSGYAPTPVEQYGFGPSAGASRGFQDSRHSRLRVSLGGGPEHLTASVDAAVQRWNNPILMAGDTEMGPVFSQLDRAKDWLSLSGTLGWRLTTRRGVRLSVRPSIFHPLKAAQDTTDRRLQGSLPAAAIDAALGIRYQLFQGDLDASVYLRGRGWTPMRSRTYDPSTALFPLAAADAREWGPYGTLDLQVEARIRHSTVFFGYQNMLDGLMHPGSLIVPTYPLPARFIQFGVFWPLFN